MIAEATIPNLAGQRGAAEALLRSLPPFLSPSPHPFLWPKTKDDCVALQVTLRSAGEPDLRRVIDYLEKREHDLQLAEEDPLQHGFEPESWKLADEQLAAVEKVLALFGANRTTKSWWAGKRFCEAARAYPGAVMVALSEKEETSIATQQKIVWNYFRPWLEPYNNKRHPYYKINYTQANGFTEGKIVLPRTRAEIYFLTYKQIATDYEGWEFGAIVEKLATRPDGSVIQNIGWWADESLTLAWLEMLARRAPFRKAKGLWSFTPVRGITPAMKEFLGAQAKALQSAPAELLPNAKALDCPPGHMPVVVQPAFPKSRAVYFHLGANPFAGYTQQVRELCEGKATEYIERVAYGFARDSTQRAFQQFGPWNVIRPDQLPATGTNYMITDPADVRPFFTLWVRVVGADRPSLYFYRDFPDCQTYGEWATPTERETSLENRRGWDGDPGPAQFNMDLGIAGYKKLWAKLESVDPNGPEEKDPYRRRLQTLQQPRMNANARESEGPEILASIGVNSRLKSEAIHERIIDPRAGPREHLGEHGGTCLLWEFEKEHDLKGERLPPLFFRLAPGKEIDQGITLVKDLLEWNQEKPLSHPLNAPRFYVSSDCQQLIWAMGNYTTLSGEKGACKDVIDTVRYAVLSDLIEVTESTWKSQGGGSY